MAKKAATYAGSKSSRFRGIYFTLQRPETHATLSIVLPFTSHFDSPQTASQG